MRRATTTKIRTTTNCIENNLWPDGFGPSLKTCPRCDPHFRQLTSVRISSGLLMIKSKLAPTENKQSEKCWMLFIKDKKINSIKPLLHDNHIINKLGHLEFGLIRALVWSVIRKHYASSTVLPKYRNWFFYWYPKTQIELIIWMEIAESCTEFFFP